MTQLVQPRGFELQIFRLALQRAPKSGEVWCEGARLHLNPLSRHFHLATAKEYLDYALRFTPQYGDSFIELLRLQLLFEANSLAPNGIAWTQADLRSVDYHAVELRSALMHDCKHVLHSRHPLRM